LALGYTCVLGGALLFNQVIELKEAALSLGERVYGSVFLVLTGLHGLHVFLGLGLLLVGGGRLICGEFTSWGHTSIELLIWY
jgi:cytochrome c oxidase subunit 3